MKQERIMKQKNPVDGDAGKIIAVLKHLGYHHCQNVFVTDGACMTSTGNQSPSLLYMALTARAANYAVEEMKKGNL